MVEAQTHSIAERELFPTITVTFVYGPDGHDGGIKYARISTGNNSTVELTAPQPLSVLDQISRAGEGGLTKNEIQGIDKEKVGSIVHKTNHTAPERIVDSTNGNRWRPSIYSLRQGVQVVETTEDQMPARDRPAQPTLEQRRTKINGAGVKSETINPTNLTKIGLDTRSGRLTLIDRNGRLEYRLISKAATILLEKLAQAQAEGDRFVTKQEIDRALREQTGRDAIAGDTIFSLIVNTLRYPSFHTNNAIEETTEGWRFLIPVEIENPYVKMNSQ